jgi:hypothetical protein
MATKRCFRTSGTDGFTGIDDGSGKWFDRALDEWVVVDAGSAERSEG